VLVQQVACCACYGMPRTFASIVRFFYARRRNGEPAAAQCKPGALPPSIISCPNGPARRWYFMAYETYDRHKPQPWRADVAPQAAQGERAARYRNALMPLLVLVAGVFLWEGLVRWQELPPFILPAPALVAQKFWSALADGTLLRHAQVTVIEIGLGLLLGLSAAFGLGYVLGKSRSLEHIAAPIIVASQSIPTVAIAPLLIIWLGSGLWSKILVAALISFFPALVSTIVGIRNVDPDLHDLMRSLRASRSQLFWRLELPAALPVLFGGLKLSVTLAVVGAVVGEFVGADAGLGFLINLGRGILDTPLMFVAVIALVIITQALYYAVVLLEKRALRWQQQ
jgi:NitT/TauT family transport system permease protein